MHSPMGQISVVIVSWNARSYLRDCLDSIRATGSGCCHEVIVVDNASADGSPEMVEANYPEVLLIRSTENLGFARANNMAMTHATGSVLAFVNSDVIVHPGCLQKLAAFLASHDDVGLVGPRVIGRDGNMQRTCHRLPTIWNYLCRALAVDRILSRSSVFSGYEMRHFDHDVVAEVEVLGGCFWVARKKAIAAVGGLDERFFFYMEDVDWCKRFKDRGWKVMFVPEATAVHFGGGSTSNDPLRYSIEILRANMKYWQKHHGLAGRVAAHALALLHHGIRLGARTLTTAAGLGTSAESKLKLREDRVCVRWLLTGRGV